MRSLNISWKQKRKHKIKPEKSEFVTNLNIVDLKINYRKILTIIVIG